jgi:hypothetical protein
VSVPRRNEPDEGQGGSSALNVPPDLAASLWGAYRLAVEARKAFLSEVEGPLRELPTMPALRRPRQQ